MAWKNNKSLGLKENMLYKDLFRIYVSCYVSYELFGSVIILIRYEIGNWLIRILLFRSVCIICRGSYRGVISYEIYETSLGEFHKFHMK